MADFKSELLRLALGNLPKGIKKVKRTGNPAGETLVIALASLARLAFDLPNEQGVTEALTDVSGIETGDLGCFPPELGQSCFARRCDRIVATMMISQTIRQTKKLVRQ